nr:MAG TPA: hypothetical protein [Caudoviricetes sp.]
MTESEAVEKLKNMRLFMQIEDENNDFKFTEDDYKANEMAIHALEKLAEYENLEEQGRLIKLPCKVGDDVYYILGIPNKMPCTIDKCVFELSDINKIGKTLFLTRESAEAKLKELRGGEDGK